MKKSLRIALLLVSGTALRFLVALLILSATIFSLFSNRSYVYSVLEQTKTYERIPLIIVNSSANQQIGQEEDTKLSSANFAPIVFNAIPEQVPELAITNIVDAHYDWLEGKEDKVTFKIDLSSSKEAIVDGITTYAVNRYLLLDECTQAVSGYDFFSVPCQIEGLDIDTQEEALRKQLSSTPILLRDTEYDDTTLLTNPAGEGIDETTPWLQDVYSRRGLIITILLILVAGLGAINLIGATSLTKGLRRVGKLVLQGCSGFLLTAIIIFVVLPLFGFHVVKTDFDAPLQISQQTYDTLVNDLIGVVAQDFAMRSMTVALPFLLIGLAFWIYGSYRLEKEQEGGGVPSARSIISASLSSSGLVSSEKEKKPKKSAKSKKPSTGRLPIVSSEADAPTSQHTKPKRRRRKKSK